jgi:hypothetical protein
MLEHVHGQRLSGMVGAVPWLSDAHVGLDGQVEGNGQARQP